MELGNEKPTVSIGEIYTTSTNVLVVLFHFVVFSCVCLVCLLHGHVI